jgi:hypothetical protein
MYVDIQVNVPATITAAMAWLYLTVVLGLTEPDAVCVMAVAVFLLARVPEASRWLSRFVGRG